MESLQILNQHRTSSTSIWPVTSGDVKAIDIRREMVLGFRLFSKTVIDAIFFKINDIVGSVGVFDIFFEPVFRLRWSNWCNSMMSIHSLPESGGTEGQDRAPDGGEGRQ